MDIVLIGFIGGFIAGGWRTGFLRRLVGIGFMAASFVLGAYLRQPLGAIIAAGFKDLPPQYADMVAYSIVFTVLLTASNIVTGPMLSKVAVGGVSKMLDKALGAILGGVEAVLIVSAAIVILDTYFGPHGSLGGDPGLGFLKGLSQSLDQSTIGQFLIKTTVPFVLAILGPFLPKDITSLIPGGIPNPGTLPGGVPLPIPTK